MGVAIEISPYTFGVYLIHTNDFVNDRIWKLLPDIYGYPVIVHCILFCLLLFFLCIMIDFIREKLFKLLRIDNMLSNVSSKLPQL